VAEHAKASQDKRTGAEPKHRRSQSESLPSFDESHSQSQRSVPLTETPFSPPIREHSAVLARIPLSAQRHEYLMHLNNAYGYRYVQRLMESQKVQAGSTPQLTIQRFAIGDLTDADFSPLKNSLQKYYDAQPDLKIFPIKWDDLSSANPRIKLKAVKDAREKLENIFKIIKFEFASKDKVNLVADLDKHYPVWLEKRQEQQKHEEAEKAKTAQGKESEAAAKRFYVGNPPVEIGALGAGNRIQDNAYNVPQGAEHCRGLKNPAEGQGLFTIGAGPCVVVALACPGAIAMAHLDSDSNGKDKCESALNRLKSLFEVSGGKNPEAFIIGGNSYDAYQNLFYHLNEKLSNVVYRRSTAGTGEIVSVQIVRRGGRFQLENIG
jgi:hypothetical protein